MPKQDIRELSFEELTQYLQSIHEKPFRANQIFDWMYQKGVWSFDDMRNVSAGLRQKLKENFALSRQRVVQKQVSEDGTTKFLFDLHDRQKVETVLIPASTRTTVCVSTQAGCKFGCRFCASGIGGWVRNLSCSEIVTQILHVKEEAQRSVESIESVGSIESTPRHNGRKRLNDQPMKPLSHIVFMGVGEPLDNFDNLIKAIRIINDKKGINIGVRRITISTCGVIPKIKKLAEEGKQIELAISLHGFDNESRNILMPVNRKYPFDELMKACREYIKATKRQITFEYILIKDVTCSQKAVKALKKAFKGMICKMNLIPYNPVSEFDHKTPSRQEMFAFKNRLQDFGIHATIRTPRGIDINSACGQLRHTN